MTGFDEVAAAMDAQAGADPLESRKALNKYGLRDQVSVLATREGGGGSNALTLLGPFTVDFDTSGFLNPVNGYGIETIPIPAGSFVTAHAVVTETFDGAQAGDSLNIVLAEEAASPAFTLVEYKAGELGADSATVFLPETKRVAEAVAYTGNVAVAVVDCFILAGLFMTDPVTQGSLDIYAIVATP